MFKSFWNQRPHLRVDTKNNGLSLYIEDFLAYFAIIADRYLGPTRNKELNYVGLTPMSF